jgi:outer membrane protein OmpA-like peptidoglycan-associated protein
VQCGSGHCTDGVCCDLACNGQCEACNVDGHVGECVAVSGAPVGGLRPACTSDGTACGGACDGAHRTACGYPQGSCRDASCAGGVATLAASCDGGGHCPAPQTQPCAPYVCGATACANGCAIDGDCAAGNWCAGGVCSALLTDGQTCSASTQCAHGHCVDGVCCDVACGGQCEACNLPGPLLGTCSPVSGAPVNGRTQCTSDGTACGGACDGADRAACAYPDASVVCRAASCAAGVAVVSAACDGAGSCPSPQQQTCAPNVCGATACASGCTSDLGCAAGYWCAAGVCAPKNGPGTACSGASQCTSGNCVDGVCCDGACSGKCEACDVPGHVGACTAVTGAPHGGARGTCPSDGTACGGSCDGAARTACSFPGTTTVCRAATCAGGVATGAASCDGGGACGATPSPIACGAYACAGDACATSCTTSADCASGLVCESATCVAPGSAGGWRLAGSGGCSATGGADLGALALLALLLAPAAARRRRGRAGVLLALALALPAAARAQSTAFDAQRFQPLGGARDVLAIPTASVPGHLEARAGVFLDYASQPLRLTGPRTVVLVDSQTDLTLTGSIGLLDRFEVSLAFPIIVQLDGKPASDASAALPASRPRQGVGDLRITPRALLLALGPLRLAAAVPVTLPTGTSAYAGQSGVTASPLAVAEWGDERGVRVAANVGVALRKRERLADLDQGSAFAFGAGGAVPFRVAGERLAGLATLTGEVGGGAVERPVELLGALRWAGRRGVEVTVGGGRGLTQGYGMPRYRFLAMVDLAGVSLRRTAREPVAEAAPPPAAPEPPPAPTPVPVAAPQPAPAPVAVPPAVVAVAPPPGPCEAGQQHAPEQCPDLDDDGDGIPNGKDRCPLLAGVPEHQGCPPPRAVLTAKRIEITEAVFFDSGKDVIQPRSFQLLDDVARILEDHAEVKVVSIEGHTDASGAAARNQLLSERRAAAVKVYLVRKGIAPERLAARGFGSARPVAKEVDAGSKAKNRRVEFLVKP